MEDTEGQYMLKKAWVWQSTPVFCNSLHTQASNCIRANKHLNCKRNLELRQDTIRDKASQKLAWHSELQLVQNTKKKELCFVSKLHVKISEAINKAFLRSATCACLFNASLTLVGGAFKHVYACMSLPCEYTKQGIANLQSSRKTDILSDTF